MRPGFEQSIVSIASRVPFLDDWIEKTLKVERIYQRCMRCQASQLQACHHGERSKGLIVVMWVVDGMQWKEVWEEAAYLK